jgi:DedD protein
MTNRDAPHDFDPKHRIIGAVVVVALAVIFVPMILNQRDAPPESATPTQATPMVQAATDETKIAITKVPPPPALSEPVKAVAPDPAKVASEPAKVAPPPPKPVVTAAKPTPTNTAKQAAARSGFVVQVGTFSDAANATRLEQKLRAEGEPVRAEQLQMASGKAVRLRVGPFPDRATAVKAQERIQKDVGVKGVVLAFP